MFSEKKYRRGFRFYFPGIFCGIFVFREFLLQNPQMFQQYFQTQQNQYDSAGQFCL